MVTPLRAARAAMSLLTAGALVALSLLAQPSLVEADIDPTSCLNGSMRPMIYVPSDSDWNSDGDIAEDWDPSLIETEETPPEFAEGYDDGSSLDPDLATPTEAQAQEDALAQQDLTLSAATTTLTLMCGGISGPVGGPGIAMPRAGGQIPATTWGRAGRGNVRENDLSRASIKNFVDDNHVPWPSATAKSASITSPYKVYVIYGKRVNGSTVTMKFGITRVGKSRPESQLGICARLLGMECKYKWIRHEASGWTKARQLEAYHAARYKARHGHCPPGMKRCL